MEKNEILPLIDEAVDKKVKDLELQYQKKAEVKKISILLHSGDFDRVFIALTIAISALTSGYEVSMFCTLLGLNTVKKKNVYKGATFSEKIGKLLMPIGIDGGGLSRRNLFGLGKFYFRHLMKQREVCTLPELMQTAKELGMKISVCEMSMHIMGITKEELIDDLNYIGEGCYINEINDSTKIMAL